MIIYKGIGENMGILDKFCPNCMNIIRKKDEKCSNCGMLVSEMKRLKEMQQNRSLHFYQKAKTQLLA